MQTNTQEQVVGNKPVARLSVSLFWGFAAAFVLLIIFIVFLESLYSDWLTGFDESVIEAVRLTRADWVTKLALFFTWIGKASTEFIVFVIVGALMVFRFKHAWETLVLFLGVLGAWGLNELIKRLVGRERPILERLAEATGFGFPSGHAMVSSSFYGLIGYLLWINLRGKWSGAWSIPVVTLLLLAGIGFSRIYLGVHYPSDVFAGFAAGGAWLAGCIMGIQGIRHYNGKR